MIDSGVRNPDFGADQFGLDGYQAIYWNDAEATLLERAVRRAEGRLTATGALAVRTGKHTGRSAKDKVVVRTPGVENDIWWDNNRPLAPDAFDRLYADMLTHTRNKTLFAQDLSAGADPDHRLNVRVYCEAAWHALFIRHLLRRPDISELSGFVPDLTIIDLPTFKAEPEIHGCRTETVIACDFERGVVLIAGTSYAGEMKKSVFTALNYLLPARGVMPMHCSANVADTGDSAIFFGLSGTGKTTLSADPERTLIGDDEHGWSENGLFNFEGGCYAKTINLSREAEPQIYDASRAFGTVLENVIIDERSRQPDFDDASLTENTRSAYPLTAIQGASETGRAGHPKAIIMLTCDAFGVLPPIAKLSPSQAMYHFLSGYTAKVAGTEKGVTEPEATFSTCFGAPFMPRHPVEYGTLLRRLIAEHDVSCWLVNTGWTGGAYGTGERMPLSTTRKLVSSALEGALDGVDTYTDANFGFQVPNSIAGVEPHLLHPRKTWEDPSDYDAQAARLVGMFNENFAKFESHVDADVLGAAPQVKIAAE
ncbi:MAG: phosphoenolpyruvate carboxykinase [Pseudomonadota bacterium]